MGWQKHGVAFYVEVTDNRVAQWSLLKHGVTFLEVPKLVSFFPPCSLKKSKSCAKITHFDPQKFPHGQILTSEIFCFEKWFLIQAKKIHRRPRKIAPFQYLSVKNSPPDPENDTS